MRYSSHVFHKKKIYLQLPPDKIRQYIKSPKCIGDYYPGIIESGKLYDGYFFCSNKFGISLFQVLIDEPRLVQLRVWTAARCKKPYTVEKLKRHTTFIIDENWELAEHNSGTELTKSWLNMQKIKYKILPMATIVRLVSKSEESTLVNAWNGYS